MSVRHGRKVSAHQSASSSAIGRGPPATTIATIPVLLFRGRGAAPTAKGFHKSREAKHVMSNLHYFHRDWIEPTDETLEVDVCVYGGNAAGVIAAVTAKRRGRSVVLLHPGRHVGGMTTGGLGWTDSGRREANGGAARRFYRDVGAVYGKDEEWQFAPSAAQQVMNGYLADTDLDVRYREFLAWVEREGNRVRAVRMLSGLRVVARAFLDCTYEGDLMARAGVPYSVGRESNATYNETLNGVQVRDIHQFSHHVDPYVEAGNPESGLLPCVEGEDLRHRQGQADHRIQAYNFRVCMTDDPDLKVPFEKPEGYDPSHYVLLGRWLHTEKTPARNHPLQEPDGSWRTVPRKVDLLPNRTPNGYHKTDTNNHGAVSSDFIGANWDYPEASYERREQIFQAHVTYQQGLYWYFTNDPAVPEPYREAYARWGLAADEFQDTQNWPHQLYVREARRMIADYVVTEHDCTGARQAPDPVCLASYTMDSHNCTRFVSLEDGHPRVRNEGDVQVRPQAPYPVSYRAIVPPQGSCENLWVPTCCACSHIAYGSVRMEPVFMMLGEAGAIAADLALAESATAQGLPYDALRGELERAGAVLEVAAEQV